MKAVLLFILFTGGALQISAQAFCFYNPNTGPHYHNGTSGAIYDITSADFNTDGFLDLVTANSTSSTISFIPGYGNGVLGNADTTSVPATLFCITSADFNGDNKQDVAAANNGNIFVLFGNGNGTFQPFVTYAAGASPSRIYSKDINNDGVADLLEAAQGGVFVLTGQNTGVFLPAVLYPTGGSDVDLAYADVDNDAIADIVSTTHISPAVSALSFLKGNINGTFNTAVSVFNMAYPENFIAGIVAHDADMDGKKDLIVTNSSNLVSRIEVYTGNGNGTFNNPAFYPTLVSPFYVYLSDLDNDLIADIVVEESNGFSVLKGNLNGTYDTFQHFSAMSTPNALAIGDFNGDNRADVVIPSAYFGSPLIAINLNCNISGIEAALPDTKSIIDVIPNPFSIFTTLRFATPLKNAGLSIQNVYGQNIDVVYHISNDEIKIERGSLQAGTYFYRLSEQGKVRAGGKFVIRD